MFSYHSAVSISSAIFGDRNIHIPSVAEAGAATLVK
jgi:hypothetical protein